MGHSKHSTKFCTISQWEPKSRANMNMNTLRGGWLIKEVSINNSTSIAYTIDVYTFGKLLYLPIFVSRNSIFPSISTFHIFRVTLSFPHNLFFTIVEELHLTTLHPKHKLVNSIQWAECPWQGNCSHTFQHLKSLMLPQPIWGSKNQIESSMLN